MFKNRNKKLICMILVFSMLISFCPNMAFASYKSDDVIIDKAKLESINNLHKATYDFSNLTTASILDVNNWAKSKISSIKSNYEKIEPLKDHWKIAEVSKLDVIPSSSTLQFLHDQTIDAKGQLIRGSGTISKNIIALRACGIDVENYYGYNLISELAKEDFTGSVWTFGPALSAFGTDDYNCTIDGLSYSEYVNSLIDKALSMRTKENIWDSWGWNDATGFMLYGLAPQYNKSQKVKDAVEEAINTISKKQLDNGDFENSYPNSNSLSMVMGSILSCNADYLNDPRLVKNENTMLHALKEYDKSDYEFYFQKGTDGSEELATEQAFRALITYLSVSDSKGMVFDYRNKPKRPINANNLDNLKSIKITKSPNKINYNEGEKLDLTGLEVTGVYNDESEEILTYYTTSLKNGDVLSVQNNEIVISVNGFTTTQKINVTSSTTGSNSSPQTKTKAYISVVVPSGQSGIYSDGKIMQEKKSFEINVGEDTAFSLLKKTGLNLKYSGDSKYGGVYLSSIDGLGEFDDGEYSGWLYKINGSFLNYSSSLYTLKEDDYVEWIYTRNLGKDVGAYVANVENNSTSIGAHTTDTVNPKIQENKLQENIKPEQVKSINISENKNKTDNILNPSQIKEILSKNAIDVKENAVTAKYIADVINKGLFVGYNDNTFKPQKQITRAQMSQIIYNYKKNTDDKIKIQNKFTDVAKNKWYNEAINFVYGNDYMIGYKNGLFKPEAKITRAEFFAIIYKILDDKTLANENYDEVLSSFKDQKDIPNWAKIQISTLIQKGLIKGIKGNIKPNEFITREQAAVILSQI